MGHRKVVSQHQPLAVSGSGVVDNGHASRVRHVDLGDRLQFGNALQFCRRRYSPRVLFVAEGAVCIISVAVCGLAGGLDGAHCWIMCVLCCAATVAGLTGGGGGTQAKRCGRSLRKTGVVVFGDFTARRNQGPAKRCTERHRSMHKGLASPGGLRSTHTTPAHSVSARRCANSPGCTSRMGSTVAATPGADGIHLGGRALYPGGLLLIVLVGI